MHRTKLSALAGSLLVVTLAACGGGGGDSDSEVKAKLAGQFAKEGLDKEASNCFAGVLVEEIGAKKLKDVDFSAEEPPAGLEDEFTAAAMKAVKNCKIDMSEISGN